MVASLFEVEVRNRVVRGIHSTRIKGRQGGWYHESLCYLAETEREARQLATKDVAERRVLGIPRFTRRHIERQVEILNVRRIV